MSERMTSFLTLLFLVMIVGACGSKEKQPKTLVSEDPVVDVALQNKFNQGIEYLDAGNYSKAQTVFRDLVIQHPSSQFHWISMYNLGASYEGLGKCKEAGKAYRKVARASMNKYPRLEAQALFRMSFAYSCLGYDEKAVAALLDAKRRSQLLQEEVALAEIPARLAAAYARLGNKVKAQEFFTQAKQGVQRLKERHKNRRAVRDILAKTLFLMGRMVPVERLAKVDSLEYLTTLQQLQIYLLEATELNSKKWSPQAAEEIHNAYENIWDLVKNVPPPNSSDPEFRDQKKRQMRFKIISEALANLKMLKADFRPGLKNNPFVVDLRQSLDQKEQVFQQFLAENAVETPLSQQAERNQGLKRQGKTQGELPLDAKARQRSRLPEKQETKKP